LAKSTGQGETPAGGDTDSSGNIFLAGFSGTSNSYGWIWKTNSSGAYIWKRQYRMNDAASSSNQMSLRGIKIIGNDIYVSGWGVDNNTQGGILMKVNGSDGSIVWQKFVVNASMIGVSYESDGFLYWTGSGQGAVVIKTDTNGTVSWDRKFTVTGSGSGGNGCRVAVSGSTLYVTGTWTPSNQAPFYVKVPTDGSKTGTYTVGASTCGWTSTTLSISSTSSIIAGSPSSANFSYDLTPTDATYVSCGAISQTTTVTQI
jgi:hypothetical protein